MHFLRTNHKTLLSLVSLILSIDGSEIREHQRQAPALTTTTLARNPFECIFNPHQHNPAFGEFLPPQVSVFFRLAAEGDPERRIDGSIFTVFHRNP